MATLPESAKGASISTGTVVPFPAIRLEADRPQLVRFANAIFRNCRGFEGYLSLSTFANVGEHVSRRWVEFGPQLVDAARTAATAAANVKGGTVFAPPVCLFRNPDRANSQNVAAGPVIAVDLDRAPQEGLDRLTSVLGTPTVVVASGGRWTAEDGRTEDKLHVYWRLLDPATSEVALVRLRHARALAAALVSGSDRTGVPVAHPMRWPGSWHTKAEPVLCRIVGGQEDRDVKLEVAIAQLEFATGGAVPCRDHRTERREGFKTPKAWTAEALLEAAKGIPNARLSWDDWNRLGMTFFDASHGCADGLEAFHAFSEKSPKYDPDETDTRWSHWYRSPPNELSGATLTHEMRKIDPMWTPTWPPAGDFDPTLFAVREEEDLGPLDIFGDADPAELGDLPADALPPMLTRWVVSEARRKGVPEAFPAASALAVLGASIGGDVRIQVRQLDDGWTETANLWVAIVAPPGSAKSPTIGAAVAPLRAIDARWVEKDGAAHAAWAAASKRRSKDAPPAGAEPRIRRIVVDDMTAEKAIRIYRDNPRGILQAPDELAGLLGGFGTYKGGGGADRSHFLRAFDGDAITSDRVGSGTIGARRALLTVLAGTQPERMHSVVRDLGSDGLLQRFLVVMNDGRERTPVDEAPDREAVRWFVTAVEQLASAGGFAPDPLQMAAEASGAFASAADRIRILKHAPGASEAFRGHLEKWGKILPRLILIVHVARQMEVGGFDPSARVECSTVDMAVRLARFLLRHALAFYTSFFASSAAASEALWIAGFLLTRPDLRRVGRRDVYDNRKTLRGADNLRVLLGAMGELEAAGWVAVGDRDATGPTSWTVDQRIHERFAERAERERRERGLRHAKILEAGKARKWLAEEDARAALASAGGIFG